MDERTGLAPTLGVTQKRPRAKGGWQGDQQHAALRDTLRRLPSEARALPARGAALPGSVSRRLRSGLATRRCPQQGRVTLGVSLDHPTLSCPSFP